MSFSVMTNRKTVWKEYKTNSEYSFSREYHPDFNRIEYLNKR